MLLVFLLYALFASVFTISKQALAFAEPFFLVGSRMLLAGCILLIFQACKDRGALLLKKGSLKKIFLLALCNIYLTNVCEFWGLKYLTSFKTCFIYSLSPFLGAFLSHIILSESLTRKKWLGLVFGFVGIMPMLLSKTSQEVLTGEFWVFSWAELAVVAACAFASLGWILLSQLVKEYNYSPFTANGYSMLLGGLFALIHSFCVEPFNPIPVSNFSSFLVCTLLLITISNFVCYNLYGYLLKKFSATFMSFAGLSTALFSALLGYLVHGEEITVSFYISFVLVLVGLVVFYQEELRTILRSSPLATGVK